MTEDKLNPTAAAYEEGYTKALDRVEQLVRDELARFQGPDSLMSMGIDDGTSRHLMKVLDMVDQVRANKM